MKRSKWMAFLMAGILSVSSIGTPVFAAESGIEEELPDEIIEDSEELIEEPDPAESEEYEQIESPEEYEQTESPDEFTYEDDSDYSSVDEGSEQTDSPHLESGEEVESVDEAENDSEGEEDAEPGYEENYSAVNSDLTVVLDNSEQSYLPYEDDQTNPDELFSQYVKKIMEIPEEKEESVSDGLLAAKSKKKYALSSFNPIERAIYDFISSEVPKIASGERTSTIFEIPVSEMGFEQLHWSAKELGVDAIVVDEIITQEAADALMQKGVYDLTKVIGQLLVDQPYYLYWFDKSTNTDTSPYEAEAIYDVDREEYLLGFTGSVHFYFPVSEDYSAGEYLVDETTGQTVQTAAENARNIVTAYSGSTDYRKLDGYRAEICNRVSYNEDALGEDVRYGNPWQLIWVFDGDPNTNVVCEGYAKAFQYLCDLSTFSDGISCITVTGTMTGGTGEGPHMWNVVRMEDGNNYLVDLTNCDEGSVGEEDQLFLASPVNGGFSQGYTFQTVDSDSFSTDITYWYESDTLSLFSEEELILSFDAYERTPVGKIVTQDKIKYELLENEAKVIGYIEKPVNVSISEKVSGLPVTAIGRSAFSQCDSLVSVTLPSQLTSIEPEAFSTCNNLKAVKVPMTVESIGQGSFSGCSILNWILIENPECRIFDSEDTVNEAAVIIGYPNSTAEQYANKYNREFVSVLDVPEPKILTYQNRKEATCTVSGTKEHYIDDAGIAYLDKLGKQVAEPDDLIIEALGHEWEEDFTTDKPATCTEAGSKSIHCSKCAAVKDSEVIPATGHNYGGWTETKAPTCTEAGSRERICTACNAKETEVVAATGHEWAATFTTDKPATCTKAGSKSIHCVNCDAKKESQTIPTKAHHVIAIKGRAATCTKSGLTAGKKCSECGKILTLQKTVKALGHSWSSWKVTKTATTTANGEKTRTCSRCKVKEKKTIAKLPKKEQPLAVSVKQITIKKVKVKKKKQTIAKSKAFIIENAQGPVTFEKAGGSGKLSISKAGKITVKKGTKKGSYKLTVKVTAAGNKDYKPGSKTVKMEIIIK